MDVNTSRPSLSKSPTVMQTRRLILRRWSATDLEPFAAMNADPKVMEFFPDALPREASDAVVARIQRHFDEHGFGLCAVDIPGVASFAGFIGLSTPRFTAHFTPCIEIGWRLAAAHWGCGYATEGAQAALDYGFQLLGLREIVSMTATINHRSRRVMEKIGMTYSPADDFDHPLMPSGHALTPHVLYRAQRNATARIA